MVLPLILGDNSTPTWTCPHGGTFKVNASMSAEESGKSVAVLGDTVAPISPCPGIPPSGIPPCAYTTGIIGTSVLKTEAGTPGASFKDIQISTTNGFPAPPPIALTTKVTTTG